MCKRVLRKIERRRRRDCFQFVVRVSRLRFFVTLFLDFCFLKSKFSFFLQLETLEMADETFDDKYGFYGLFICLLKFPSISSVIA